MIPAIISTRFRREKSDPEKCNENSNHKTCRCPSLKTIVPSGLATSGRVMCVIVNPRIALPLAAYPGLSSFVPSGRGYQLPRKMLQYIISIHNQSTFSFMNIHNHQRTTREGIFDLRLMITRSQSYADRSKIFNRSI
jgi:hypothetical protein